jgi:glycosyltransferase involved in cell wall biosynthesis
MRLEHLFLLNFAASYSEGGYKRLYEYSRWFNQHGGTYFAIHPRCAHLAKEFPSNRFFVVAQSRLRRLFDDRSYLNKILEDIGQPDLYFAYGIPMYGPVGRINWAHLNNILTVGTHVAPISKLHRLKYWYLGRRICRGFAKSDVISAESRFSLQVIAAAGFGNLFLSKNGADDEIASLRQGNHAPAENVATVVGTHNHKALRETLVVFQMLKQEHQQLKLVVIGDARRVPDVMRHRPDVEIRDALPRPAVIEFLRRSRYYISTTYVENSCNGASEGVFLAQTSFITDIPPHAELLAGEQFDHVTVPGLSRPFLRLERSRLRGLNLESWDTIVNAMVAKANAIP